MIVNRHRGEVKAQLDGKPFVLCLTLGALAELESRFGVDDLNALTERFGTGRLAAADLTRIVGAGLRGAGHLIEDGEVQTMQIEGGATGWARLVAELLEATFGEPASDNPSHPAP
ncbi:MAG: gene transfer agent family protein [Pseudomonadota bacterium]